MEPMKGYDAWKTNAPEPPEIDWDGLLLEMDACPFCGNPEPWIDEDKAPVTGYWAKCSDCEARGPARREPQDAVDAWNKRS